VGVGIGNALSVEPKALVFVIEKVACVLNAVSAL